MAIDGVNSASESKTAQLDLPDELLHKYNVPGPRYTSYPPASGPPSGGSQRMQIRSGSASARTPRGAAGGSTGESTARLETSLRSPPRRTETIA